MSTFKMQGVKQNPNHLKVNLQNLDIAYSVNP